MPKGIKMSLGDKVFRLLNAHPFDDGLDAIAEVFAYGLKDDTMAYLHEVCGDLHLRACALRAEVIVEEMNNPKTSKAKIIKRTTAPKAPATAPKRVRRTPRGQAGKPDTGKTIQRRRRKAA